jgi:maltose/moltooligosaccharide transporter
MDIPVSIQWAYIIGAVMLFSTTLWTFNRVDEPSPAAIESNGTVNSDQPGEQERQSFWRTFGKAIVHLPPTMRKLAWVQVFTWAGMYSIFLYLPTAIAINLLGATNRQFPDYVHGVEWAGICIAFYNLVCLVVSLLIPMLSRWLGRVTTHSLCLMSGGFGLVSLLLMHHRYPILLAMVGVGIAWASILSIPYALLVDEVDESQRGIYMGLFNCFVTLPQIAISLGFGWFMDQFLQGNRLWAIALGGLSMGISALLMLRVSDPKAESASELEIEAS